MYPSAVSPALIVVEILCMSGNTYGTAASASTEEP